MLRITVLQIRRECGPCVILSRSDLCRHSGFRSPAWSSLLTANTFINLKYEVDSNETIGIKV
jgi:hypothetical protein